MNDNHEFWRLSGNTAALSYHRFHATVDLQRPDQGLTVTGVDGASLGQLLQLRVLQDGAGDLCQPTDAFVRGPDLAAAYEPTDDRPFRVHIYWRIGDAESTRVGGLVVDAIVSLQTQMWEAYPKIAVGSSLEAESVGAVGPAGGVDFVSLAEIAERSLQRKGQSTLVRLASGDSYVEGRIASDFDDWRASTADSGRCLTESRYAAKFMERGVIRRLTLRAAIIPREGDVERAREISQRLARERPTLTA